MVLDNVGNEPARFQVELRYPDGPYSIKQRELAVGETATFDLRQIRDEQQPDRTGKTLPLTLDRGQFHWTIVATHGDPHIIGRAEVVSRSGRVASSYSCPVCCPDSGPAGHFDPSAYGLSVDGFVYTNAHGDYYDCYYNYYQGSLSFTQMFTYNASIATVDGGGQLNGITVGSTDVEGDYDYVEWDNDGMDCYRYYGSGSDTAPVDVIPVRYTTVTQEYGTGSFTAGFGGQSWNATLSLPSNSPPCTGTSFSMHVNLHKDDGATSYGASDPRNIPDTPSDSQYRINGGGLQDGDSSSPHFDMILRRITPSNPNRHIRFPLAGYSQYGGFSTVGFVTINCQ